MRRFRRGARPKRTRCGTVREGNEAFAAAAALDCRDLPGMVPGRPEPSRFPARRATDGAPLLGCGASCRNAAGGPTNPLPSPRGPVGKDDADLFFRTRSDTAGTVSLDPKESERILRGYRPRSRSHRRGKYPGAEAAIGQDRCFILVKIAAPERVRRFFFFSRLFLDSPPETPYLVCVMNSHHKIRHHKVG